MESNKQSNVESTSKDEQNVENNIVNEREPHADVRDIAQETREFVEQLKNDPRYASLLQSEKGNKTKDDADDNVSTEAESKNRINEFIEEKSKKDDTKDSVLTKKTEREPGKTIPVQKTTIVEEIEVDDESNNNNNNNNNSITSTQVANVAAPIVESPVVTPLSVAHVAPHAKRSTFAIPVIANKRYISEERESTAAPLVDFTTIDGGDNTIIVNKASLSGTQAKTPVIISASSSSTSSSPSSSSLDTENFEESSELEELPEEQEEEEEEWEETFHGVVKRKKSELLASNKKNSSSRSKNTNNDDDNVEEVEPIAISSSLTASFASASLLTKHAQHTMNLHDAPLLGSVVKNKNMSWSLSRQPTQDTLHQSTTEQNVNVLNSIVNNENKLHMENIENNNDVICPNISPIKQRESLQRSFSLEALAVNNKELNNINVTLSNTSPSIVSKQKVNMQSQTNTFTEQPTNSVDNNNNNNNNKEVVSDIKREQVTPRKRLREVEHGNVANLYYLQRFISRMNAMNEKMNKLALQCEYARSVQHNTNNVNTNSITASFSR